MLYSIRPCAGELIAFLWSLVMRGGRKPPVVLLASSTADAAMTFVSAVPTNILFADLKETLCKLALLKFTEPLPVYVIFVLVRVRTSLIVPPFAEVAIASCGVDIPPLIPLLYNRISEY